jgi:dolichol-phosphate mannosyltransferase
MNRALTALPVYNEARHVAPVLDEVLRHCREVLVVDDGSRDGTAAILAGYRPEGGGGNVYVVSHAHNRGYGAALQSAFDFALDKGYDVLVTIDCDGQHEPCMIPQFIARAATPTQGTGCPAGCPADIVSGSRYLKKFPGDSRPPEERRRINQLITERVNRQLGLRLSDAFCGFKAYRVPILAKFSLSEMGYAMPLELWVQAAALRLKIVEMPVPLIYLDEARSFGGALDHGETRLKVYEDVLDRALARAGIVPKDDACGCSRVARRCC